MRLIAVGAAMGAVMISVVGAVMGVMMGSVMGAVMGAVMGSVMMGAVMGAMMGVVMGVVMGAVSTSSRIANVGLGVSFCWTVSCVCVDAHVHSSPLLHIPLLRQLWQIGSSAGASCLMKPVCASLKWHLSPNLQVPDVWNALQKMAFFTSDV